MTDDKKNQRPDSGAAPEPIEDDTEGHNLFSTSDYYVQSKMGRQVDREREGRQRALAKEARNNKPERR